MRRAFLIHNIVGFKGWETCFRSIMEKADTFQIIFQVQSDALDAEGLNAGKQEFLNLPSIRISAYGGMEDSIQVAGELKMGARELFLRFMAPAFQGYKPDLWSFQFLEGDDVVLKVEDFTVGLLFLEESEVEGLVARGVNETSLEEIDVL